MERFGEMIVETARAIAPNLTIIDGIIGHEAMDLVVVNQKI